MAEMAAVDIPDHMCMYTWPSIEIAQGKYRLQTLEPNVGIICFRSPGNYICVTCG